jgi:hypothetical protein
MVDKPEQPKAQTLNRKKPGRIYAVAVCWDPNEGIFSAAGEWLIDCWEADIGPVCFRSPQAFNSRKEAEEWGRENDPEESLQEWIEDDET